MGLALGTKLTIAGGVAAMAVGVPLIVDSGFRRRALGLFLGGVAITAGFWFLRNLIHSGNPLPWLQELGPIDLPGPDRGLEGRDDFSVAHYIFENPDVDVWSRTSTRRSPTCSGRSGSCSSGRRGSGRCSPSVRPRSAAVRLCGAVTIAGRRSPTCSRR